MVSKNVRDLTPEEAERFSPRRDLGSGLRYLAETTALGPDPNATATTPSHDQPEGER